MKKLISSLLIGFLATLPAYATENGGPAFLYDSSGNGLTSTTGALNVSFGASTFAVTQSTSPWVTKDLADGSVTGGTAGTFSLLHGAVFNTSLPTLTNGQQVAMQVDSSGRLIIRPLVSGTDSVASVQSGTWTVQPGNTPNSTPWLFTINQGGNSATVSAGGALKVDGSAVTQPVNGTVTANIGTTGGLALDASVTGLQVSQGSTTSGQKGDLVLGAVTSSFPTYTTAQSNPLSLDTAGNLRVINSATQVVSGTVTAIPADGVKSAYSVVMINVAPASAATDVFTIIGSGTKIVRIRALTVYGSQTTGSVVPISLVKRSTANTGGTSTTGTAVPFSSGDAAATAVVSAYTANPSSLGTSLGNLSYEIPFIPIVKDTLFDYNFNLVPYQVYTLNSAAETIAVNLGAATVTGGSLSLKIQWTEE